MVVQLASEFGVFLRLSAPKLFCATVVRIFLASWGLFGGGRMMADDISFLGEKISSACLWSEPHTVGLVQRCKEGLRSSNSGGFEIWAFEYLYQYGD